MGKHAAMHLMLVIQISLSPQLNQHPVILYGAFHEKMVLSAMCITIRASARDFDTYFISEQ